MRPITDEQWQAAVNTAHATLTLELGQLFQLVKAIPAFDIDECLTILAEGAERGIYPNPSVTLLVGAVEKLLTKCDEKLRVLSTHTWLGDELDELRAAVELTKRERTFSYAR